MTPSYAGVSRSSVGTVQSKHLTNAYIMHAINNVFFCDRIYGMCSYIIGSTILILCVAKTRNIIFYKLTHAHARQFNVSWIYLCCKSGMFAAIHCEMRYTRDKKNTGYKNPLMSGQYSSLHIQQWSSKVQGILTNLRICLCTLKISKSTQKTRSKIWKKFVPYKCHILQWSISDLTHSAIPCQLMEQVTIDWLP